MSLGPGFVKMLGIGCFALFWNGLLGVFLVAVILPDFRRKDPEWLFAIFLIPFVLAGLGLLGALLYRLLASFNPRPRLIWTVEASLEPDGAVDRVTLVSAHGAREVML